MSLDANIAAAMHMGRTIGLTGDGLAGYIQKETSAHPDLVAMAIREAEAPPSVRVEQNGETWISPELLQAAGLPYSTALPVKVRGGKIVIG